MRTYRVLTDTAGRGTPVPLRTTRLRTFGAVELERQDGDGSWSLLQRGGKALAVLVYLSMTPGRAIPRERLSSLVWGDESPERARGSLRQSLYLLRQALGDSAIVSRGDDVELRADLLDLDRDAFVAQSRMGQLAQMLTLYRGPFCDRMELGTAADFERWVSAERARLEGLLTSVAATEVPALIARGDLGAALEAARRLADLLPEDAGIAVLAFDALVANGRVAEARALVASVRVQLESQGESIPHELSERLSRLERAPLALPAPAHGTTSMLGQVLVGRGEQLSALLREAEWAREHGTSRVLLVGQAGFGKTRVVDEFEARMRLRGARIVRVRVLPGMQRIRRSALGDIVRGLAALPGALGVDERTAETLVRFLPDLGSRFTGVRLERERTDSGLMPLRDAYVDLCSSVSERRLVIIVVDDLHYADEESISVLSSTPPDPAQRLLEVWATRPLSTMDTLGAGVTVVVPPLSIEEVRSLLSGVAEWPRTSQADAILSRLYDRSRGVPQRVLYAVRAAHASGAIALSNGAWTVTDSPQLAEAVGSNVAPDATIDSLNQVDGRLLQLIAAWARPIDEQDLVGIAALDHVPRTPEQVSTALKHLESLGLIHSRESTWLLAHDMVAEAVANAGAKHSLEDPFDAFLAYWGARDRLTVGMLEHLSLLAGASASVSRSLRLIATASHVPTLRRMGISGRSLARLVARASGRPEDEQRFLAGMTLTARARPRTLAMIAAIGTVVVGALLWLGVQLTPRLVVELEPMSENPQPFELSEFSVQPRVAVKNGFGSTLNLDGVVRARVRRGTVSGDTIVPLRSGVANFRALTYSLDSTVSDADQIRMEFSGPRFTRAATTPIRGLSMSFVRDAFRLVGASVDNVPVSDSLVHRLPLADSIDVSVTFEYTTVRATANYVVGASPSWGVPSRDVVRLAGLPRPVQGAWRTVRFKLPPPRSVGTHHLLVLFGAEGDAALLFSNTNWTAGLPVWGDGNDALDAGYEAFERLRTEGELWLPGSMRVAPHGLLALGPSPFPPIVDSSPPRVRRLGSAIRLEFY